MKDVRVADVVTKKEDGTDVTQT